MPVSVRDNKGASPLHYAAALHKGEDLGKQLVDGGAKLDDVDKRGRTAMHGQMVDFLA